MTGISRSVSGARTTPRSSKCSPDPGTRSTIVRETSTSPGEVVFWEDLKRNPENGWALSDLLDALRAQKKSAEAAHVEARLQKAWKNTDVKRRSPGT